MCDGKREIELAEENEFLQQKLKDMEDKNTDMESSIDDLEQETDDEGLVYKNIRNY